MIAGLCLLKHRGPRQVLILLASVVFYASWKPAYVFVLAAPAVVDYFCAIRIEESSSPISRKRWLLVSLISNLGLLAYFKYTNFLIDTVAAVVGIQARHLSIILPIGISFFIFKTLSYTIDVYRGDLQACRSWWRYAMFVSYFPELVAGPIVRASVFLPQLTRSLRFSWRRAGLGLQMILLGLTKKVLIADRMAIYADVVFLDPAAFSPWAVTQGVLAYALQIYCDFSGYSDMAIGISKIIGFDLPENFRMPYSATSITDFWRRWHITLSQWLRDYLYIPLGGNRHGNSNTYRNILITMFLGGLWHGANWTFVAWGGAHGLALMVHRACRSRFGVLFGGGLAASLVGWFCTFGFVSLGWVLFRSPDFATALQIYKKLAWIDTSGASWVYSPLWMLLPFILVAHVMGRLCEEIAGRASRQRRLAASSALNLIYDKAQPTLAYRSRHSGWYLLLPLPGFAGGFILTMWLLGLLLFSVVESKPFIYFQF